jgi:hypothetical protein
MKVGVGSMLPFNSVDGIPYGYLLTCSFYTVFYLGIMVMRWQNLLVKYVIGAVVIFSITYFGCV